MASRRTQGQANAILRPFPRTTKFPELPSKILGHY